MSVTSLGRLTLDLAINLMGFTDGMNRAERETAERTRNMQESVTSFREHLARELGGTQIGDIIDGFNERFGSIEGNITKMSAALGGMAIGGAVVATGALARMAIETAQADKELYILANRANTSVRNFQVLEKASAQFGVTQDQLGSILADVQEKLGEFSATEGGGAADFFEALQNNTSLTTDEIRELGKAVQGKDGVEAIQLLKNKMDELGATSQEQRFVFESLASDLSNLLPLFDQGGAKLADYEEALDKAGVVKTEEAIQNSIIFSNQIQDLKTKFEGLHTQLVADSIPAFSVLISYFTKGATEGDKFGGSVSKMGSITRSVAVGIVGISAAVGILVTVMQQFGQQIANIGSTAYNFFQADGLMAKGRALADGMTNSMAIGLKGLYDIGTEYQSAQQHIKAIINGVTMPGASHNVLFGDDVLAGIKANNEGLAINTKQADENAKANEKAAKAKDKNAKATKELSRMEQVHAAFVKAGMSDNQARIMTAEVGREGSFLDKNLFGYHKDPHNGAINAGMISWQGDRGKALIKHLTELGLIKNGKMVQSQEALDAQAMFVVKEIMGNKRFAATKNNFLTKPDISYQDGNRVLGKNYIAWRYDDPKYNSGHKNRDKYYNQLNAKLGNKGLVNDLVSQAKDEQKALEEQQRAAEQLAKEQQSIRERYMNEHERSKNEHDKKMAEIDARFGKDSVEAVKYRAEEKARYQEEQAARVYSIMSKYQSEEEKLEHEFQEAQKEIRSKFAKDSPEYAIAMDKLEVFHREELQKIREQDAKKFIQQQQHIDGIRRLMQQSSYEAAATVGDIIARRTMKPDDYQRYSLGSQEDSARAGVNAQYADREAEINRTNNLGEYVIESAAERYEWLQKAKREHEEAMYAVELEYGDKRKELEKEVTDNKVAMYQSATSSVLGLMQGFFGESKNLQRLAWAAEKGFTIARILIKEKEAFMNAWASAPFPYNLGAVATTAIQTGALAAAASAITPKGFKTGGYTGNLGVNTVAGVVHGNEYVFDAQATKAIGTDNLERIRKGKGTGELSVQVNNYSNATVDTQKDSDGNLVLTIRDEVKRSWSNLQNPNSHESKMLGRNVQAPRRRT